MHRREVLEALGVDRGNLGGPALREDELVVGEGSTLLAGHRNVEGGMTAEREGEVRLARVGDGKGLREAPVGNGIRHVEPEVEGVGGTRLVRRDELVGDARGGLIHDGVVVEARDAMTPQRDVSPCGDGVTSAQAANDGEEHRRTTRPVALVTLPEVLALAEPHAHELGAGRVNGC